MRLRLASPARRRQSRVSAAGPLDDNLRRLQRLVMQGELAATAVHEISNLQTIVLFNAGLLRQERKDDPAVAKYIDPLLHAATLIASLCTQLRNLAHPVEALPRRMDLGEVALGTHRLLEHIIPRELVFTGSGVAPVPVIADPSQVEQMLINLVLNARDATPEEGGRITVRVGINPRGRPFLEVEDNGTGMSPQVRAKLFRKFFTTKEPGRGTGLGLATVRRLLESVGGRIELRSRVGRGTRIRLVFPVAPAEPAPSADDNHQP
ncbi:MAG: sensor histidine kinase [Verrucomicrobiota bacterium]